MSYNIKKAKTAFDVPHELWLLAAQIKEHNYTIADFKERVLNNMNYYGVWLIRNEDSLVGFAVVAPPNDLEHESFIIAAYSLAPVSTNAKVLQKIETWTYDKGGKSVGMITSRSPKAFKRGWNFEVAGHYMRKPLKKKEEN